MTKKKNFKKLRKCYLSSMLKLAAIFVKIKGLIVLKLEEFIELPKEEKEKFLEKLQEKQ